jgi:hypothetical protein
MIRKALYTYGILIGGIGIALFASSSTPANAASCWCKIQCAFPGGSTYSNTPSWDNGNYPFSGRQWSTCESNCRTAVFGLDLEAIARERNVCGTVECTSSYWLGARPARDGDPRRMQVACLPPTGPGDGAETDSQYAAKFVCGPSPNSLVEPGDYRSTINIHNPQYQTVDIRYKVALAGPQADGTKSAFVFSKIGPDGAQAFDCDYIRKLSGGAGLIDGFFVIESKLPLDVLGYYTGTSIAQVATAIHIERYVPRAIPARNPLCTPNLTVNLADVRNWVRANNSQVDVVSPLIGAWDQGRPWMSYTASGYSGENKSFTYQLDFCSCTEGAVVVRGDAKSDNSAFGALVASSGTPQILSIPGGGNFGPGPPAAMTGTATNVGTGYIEITVNNVGGPTGLSTMGSFILGDGYLGACKK